MTECALVDADGSRQNDAMSGDWRHRTAMSQLSRDELEFRAAALDATAIFSVTDINGKIVEVNGKFCEISGYSRDELIGQDHRMLKSGVHPAETFRQMYRTIECGETWRGRLCNRAKSGHLYWVDTAIIPRCNANGNVVAYTAIRLDVTERKQTEEALRRGETLLRSTLRALSEGVVVQDRGGRIISCNPAAEAILGLNQDELSDFTSASRHWRAIQEDGSDFPGSKHPAMVALATGKAQHGVVVGLRGDDGSITWISINSEPIFVDGNLTPNSVVTSFSDITARKQAQDLLTEAINASPDAFVVYDELDRLMICNEAYRQMYAQSAAAIYPGTSFEDVLYCGLENNQYPEAGKTPEQRSAWLAERMRLHRSPSTDVIQHLSHDRFVQLRERRTASGHTVGFRVDVTELKRETAKLQAVIDNFPGGISFLDADYKLVACNQTFRTLLQIPSDLFEHGMPTLEMVLRANALRGEYGPGDPDEQVRTRLDLARKGEAHLFERIRPDGTVLEVRGTPIRGGGFITTYVDVTARHLVEKQLNDSERRAREQAATLEITLAHMSQGLSMFDADGRLMVWNDRYVEIYGMSPDIIKQGVSIHAIVEHLPRIGYLGTDEPNWQQKLSDRCTVASTERFNDGRVIRIVRTPIEGSGWVATHEDITEQTRAEESLLQQATELALINKRFDAALTNMSQGLCLLDADKKLIISNRRFREIYNLEEEQVEPGMSLTHILQRHIESGAKSDSAVDAPFEIMPTERDQNYRLADGRIISIRHISTPDGGWVSTHEDITERERAAEQISHLAYHDVLTGLANRAEFKARGEAALASAARRGDLTCVLLVDLDRFKAVNDSLGHAAGDKLLRLVAERMRQNVRAVDVVARLGGDEFAIFQDCAPDQREAAISLATRLVDVIGAPYDLDGHQATIGASIGVAIGSERGDSIEHLMHKADLALYKVKTRGRNGYRIYEEALGDQAQDRLLLENELREGIAAGALELYYQPIVSLANESICGMEALVRWKHPSRGMLPADQFIPLAEQAGLALQLRYRKASESMGNHDSEIVDAGSVD